MNYPISHVIPAKAGIQLIEQFPHSGPKSGYCLLCRLYIWLDSRFRGNDAAFSMTEK